MHFTDKENVAKAEEAGYLFDELEAETAIQKEIQKTFDSKIGKSSWVPIDYDKTAAWVYLLGKASFDYAALTLILGEIRARTATQNFRPRTMLDFGSGVGSCTWYTYMYSSST